MRNRKRGYILVATCLSLTFLLGVSGLSLDIGRMYIAINEAQAYVDSAALAAAKQLDGTPPVLLAPTARPPATAISGDSIAPRSPTSPPPITNSATGTFVSSPGDPTGYNYVKVVAVVSLPVYLIRILSSPAATVAASAVAGTNTFTTLPSGVFPFSPYTRTWTVTTVGGNDVGSAQPDNASDPYGAQSKASDRICGLGYHYPPGIWSAATTSPVVRFPRE